MLELAAAVALVQALETKSCMTPKGRLLLISGVWLLDADIAARAKGGHNIDVTWLCCDTQRRQSPSSPFNNVIVGVALLFVWK